MDRVRRAARAGRRRRDDADAVATSAEALAFNVRPIRSALDALFVVRACVAPSLSAVALWGFVRRRSVFQP